MCSGSARITFRILLHVFFSGSETLRCSTFVLAYWIQTLVARLVLKKHNSSWSGGHNLQLIYFFVYLLSSPPQFVSFCLENGGGNATALGLCGPVGQVFCQPIAFFFKRCAGTPPGESDGMSWGANGWC